MITVDGGAKSGSGTIVRYSVALASLLGKRIRIENIRARRDKPGLRAQHLKVIQACQEMCRGWWKMLRWALRKLATSLKRGLREGNIAGT